MQSLVWAFGSMIVLISILSFLPLGFTLKGKFTIAITAFVLALGGLAAVATFPLWQTALMVAVLVLLTAYIMEGKIGAVIFKENVASEEFLDKVKTLNRQIEDSIDDTLLDINELNTTDKIKSSDQTSLVQPMLGLKKDHIDPFLDEEISFLLDRNGEIGNEDKTVENELGSFSDIERMLNEETVDQEENHDQSWLEELDDLSSITLDSEKPSPMKLEDSENLLAVKEAAASKAHDENELNKKTSKLE